MFGFIFILSLISAFLEATLLPALKIAGGMIELGTIAITVMMFFRSLRYSSIFLLLSAIFLSVFSQMPIIYFLLPNFIVLAILLFLINRRILTKPGTLASFFIFFTAVVVANLVKIVMLASFSLVSIYTILPNALYSAVIATIIYFVANRIYLYFNPQVLREEIKII